MSWREEAKKRAAVEAVKHVKNGDVIGLGTGSTAAYAIKEICRRIAKEQLRVLGVPTSRRAALLASDCGIPLTTLDQHPVLDLDIDGADQIDPELNLIKGKGGALTKEKVVAAVSKRFIVVADETKLTDVLGKEQLLPVEVLPFAVSLAKSKIRAIGGQPVLRKKEDNSGPYVTDNGNFILDVNFGVIEDPYQLQQQLKVIPGVVETGLFLGMADIAYIGTKTGLNVMKRTR